MDDHDEGSIQLIWERFEERLERLYTPGRSPDAHDRTFRQHRRRVIKRDVTLRNTRLLRSSSIFWKSVAAARAVTSGQVAPRDAAVLPQPPGSRKCLVLVSRGGGDRIIIRITRDSLLGNNGGCPQHAAADVLRRLSRIPACELSYLAHTLLYTLSDCPRVLHCRLPACRRGLPTGAGTTPPDRECHVGPVPPSRRRAARAHGFRDLIAVQRQSLLAEALPTDGCACQNWIVRAIPAASSPVGRADGRSELAGRCSYSSIFDSSVLPSCGQFCDPTCGDPVERQPLSVPLGKPVNESLGALLPTGAQRETPSCSSSIAGAHRPFFAQALARSCAAGTRKTCLTNYTLRYLELSSCCLIVNVVRSRKSFSGPASMPAKQQSDGSA